MLSNDLPETVRAKALEVWTHLSEGKFGAPSDVVLRVLGSSEFVRESLRRYPQWLELFATPGALDAPVDRALYHPALCRQLDRAESEEAFMACLRVERRREMVRIAWRDLGGIATVEETLAELTTLAEVLLDAALERVYRTQCARFGVPRSADGEPQRLVVLALGKLGSFELNFSSDIDLIFAFPRSGDTDGKERPLGNEQFFLRVAQRLIHTLSEHTEDGFVFRVDMRLRPFGNSGALTATFDQLEDYYQSYGRDWERFAFIRARVVAGDMAAGAELLERLRPFVYRRYLDFAALVSLREIKARIAQDLRGKRADPDKNDIKRGWGGIRELEFIVQAFQLLRGAAHPELQSGAILTLLPRLNALALLSAPACESLERAYRFLRTVENRLQASRDQQTHTLPSDPGDRLSLAAAMGFDAWPALEGALRIHREAVRTQFDLVLGDPDSALAASDATNSLLGRAWDTVEDDPDGSAALFLEAGFDDGHEFVQRLRTLKENYRYRTLGEPAQRRVAQLMESVLAGVGGYPAPLETLGRALLVITGILQRTAYLALLTERPIACEQLIRLCAASPWLTQHLAAHPQTFDELLDPRTLYTPPDRNELESGLVERLHPIPRGDEELETNALRFFQQSNVLRVAAADIAGAIPLMVVSDCLTMIAETCLQKVLELAWRDLVSRYGTPMITDVDGDHVARFGIVAYGKLGGFELSYGSDLDLVFLHASKGPGQVTNGERSIDNGVFFARLGQRVINYLSAYTSAGRLYEVDSRLRPSGSAGQLVSSIDAFERYQLEEAWTWEHQALVRARYVAGDPGLGGQFEAVRRRVLLAPRDPEALRQAVREMRERMHRELGSGSANSFHLKQDSGGIADIEFLVQYGVLRWADALGNSIAFTDNVRLLEAFEQCGVATTAEASFLRDTYRTYRARVHELDLQDLPSIVDGAEFSDIRRRVRSLWLRWMGTGMAPMDET